MIPKYTPPPWHTVRTGNPIEMNIIADNGRVIARGVYHEDAERICLVMNSYDKFQETGLAKGSLMDAVRQFLELVDAGKDTKLGLDYLRRVRDKFKQ